MLRALLPLVALVALALSSCARPRVEEVRLADSRFAIHFGACGSTHTCMGTSPLAVTVTVAALFGASIACTRVEYVVNGMRSTIEPDCAPEPAGEPEGGLLIKRLVFPRGEHVLTVEAQEPGRRPVRAVRLVVAI